MIRHMVKTPLIILLFLLCGCSYYETPTISRAEIDYRLYADVESTRQACLRSCGSDLACRQRLKSAIACANYDLEIGHCTIHMPQREWERYTVHEMAHCLLGKTH